MQGPSWKRMRSLTRSVILGLFFRFATSERNHFNSSCSISLKNFSLGELGFLSNAPERVIDTLGGEGEEVNFIVFYFIF